MLSNLILSAIVLAQNGIWDNAGSSLAVCVHTLLLPDQKILCVERAHTLPYPPNKFTNAEVAVELNLKGQVNADGTWNATGQVVPIGDTPFCGGHAQMADGRLLFVGGDKQRWERLDGSISYPEGHMSKRIYNPCKTVECKAGSWIPETPMTTGRWYPTVTTLYNGENIIVGGVVGNIGAWPRILEILTWAFPYSLYPTVLQMPSGNLFIFVSNKSIILNPNTEEIAFKIPDLIAPDQLPWIYPHTPTFTVLPMTYANSHKFTVQVCGGSVASAALTSKIASKQCWQISPEEDKPVWKRVDDMPNARIMVDSVILPDGKILYLNGAGSGTAGGNAGDCAYANNPVLATDLFDPTAPVGKQWSTLASAKYQRLYHSEAILVQSGHIITTGSEMLNLGDYWGGGNPDPKCYPKGNNTCTDPFNYMMERFTPPYLQKGSRPEIVSTPTELDYNVAFDIKVSGAIKKVVFIRYGTVTHSTNFDQRYIELAILKNENGNIQARSPWNPAMAPPGNWMLWVLNGDNVPSESKTVLLKYVPGANYSFALQDPNPKPLNSGSSEEKSFVGVLLSLLTLLLV